MIPKEETNVLVATEQSVQPIPAMEKHTNALIAHYLRDHKYSATLAAFEQELGLRFNPNTPLNSDESLDAIIADRVNFQEIESNAAADDEINKLDTIVHSDAVKDKHIQLPMWSLKYPDSKEVISLGTMSALIITSAYFQSFVDGKEYNMGLFVTNTKYLIIFDIDANEVVLAKMDPFGNKQQVKIVAGVHGTNYIVLCDMDGNLASVKLTKSEDEWQLSPVSQSLKLHRRLITDFKFFSFKDPEMPELMGYFASIGWDSRVTFGRVITDSTMGAESVPVFQNIGEYKLFTNPTCVLITQDKGTTLPVLIVGRLDSSLLTLFTITSHTAGNLVEFAKLSLNDAQFSSHSFQPMAIAEISNVSSSSTDGATIITVATNHVPYMRLITLVVPSIREVLKSDNTLQSLYEANKDTTESFHSKAPVLRNYIFSNFNSLSPQDKYSNAIILSRPNCSGVWIPGDDGKLRGFDLKTGNVVETLDSNDGRAKSSFIGNYGPNGNMETIVVCGAVDKKIVIWKASN